MTNNNITLSPDQENALENILKWWDFVYNQEEIADKKDQVLTLGGYAGTGKTTILSFLREELGKDIKVGFVSLTGKAVSVMSGKLYNTGVAKAEDTISTLHSYMYTPIIDSYGNIQGWNWKPMGSSQDSAPEVDLFINDEASMTSQELYEDLLSYNKPILAIGDHGQLPPVSGTFNLMESPIIKLEKIHRQAEDNPILHLATLAREGKTIPMGEYSSKVKKIPKSEASSNTRLSEILEHPSEDRVILTATNTSRVSFNKTIRRSLNFQEGKPEPGDKVICLKNSWKDGVYNGLLGELKEIKNDRLFPKVNWYATIKEYQGRTFRLPITKHTFNNPKPSNGDINWKEMGTQWDYGYCLTCHKAQGSEFQTVVVYGEAWPEIRNRWLYTAITRAQEELYLIN